MNTTTLQVLAVWLVLMLSTVLSTWGFSRPLFSPGTATLAVMGIAAIKLILVMEYFMGLHQAPRAWRVAGALWVSAAAGMVVLIYLL
ncbi:MAG: cytochrome C oxidase subunit IV family protein [Pseudomonadota bacterium]